MKKQVAQLEALLFTRGSPVTKKNAATSLSCSLEELDRVVAVLSEAHCGVVVVDDGVSLSLASSPEVGDFLQKIHKKERTASLSHAAQETLSIIAYLGPVAKVDLDFLRGVNTQYTLRQLTIRGLVQETVVGKTRAYEITGEFLSHLGMQRKQELPEYEEISSTLQKGIQAARSGREA